MKIKWVTNIVEENAEGYMRDNKGTFVSEPRPTQLHSVEELTKIGLVGIYQAKDETLPEHLPEAIICSDAEN